MQKIIKRMLAILFSDKVDFRTKKITKRKIGIPHNNKRVTHQEKHS